MLDCVTDIPLPGRILVHTSATHGEAAQRHAIPAFVAGPENRLIASAVDGLLRSSSRLGNSPESAATRTPFKLLIVFGPNGAGKSHLAQGLVRHWQTQHGEASAVYTTAADFRHLLNDAVKRQAELGFRQQFRGRQLLVIDDLQHLPAADFALDELRYTLDDYEENGGIVLLTATSSPSTLPNLTADLCSRFAAGLVLQITHPGDAARVRIIRYAAAALGSTLTDDVATRLAHGLDGSANQLFSAILELTSSKRTGTIDATRADRLLADRAARRPTLRTIIAAVARHQKVTQAQLKSASRRHSIVFARGLVAFLARELAVSNYEEIGRALGGRDHTTILHGYRKIAHDRAHDPQIQQTLEQLKQTLQMR